MSDGSDIYEGLQALAKSAFPKKCCNCGRLYETAEAFIAETEQMQRCSGLKASQDDDGSHIVELFRNCPCGSTLMDVFNNRRDLSENGLKRRKNFEKLMQRVQKEYDIDEPTSRDELLKIMRGSRSDIIKNIVPSTKKPK